MTLLANDAFLQLFLTLSLIFFLKSYTFFATIFFALAISVKVGALMWLPGVLLVVAKQRGLYSVPLFILFNVGFFLLLGMPYIEANRDGFFS